MKTNQNNSDKKKEFINEEIWILTINGGFGRAKVYDAAQSIDEKLKSNLRKFIRKEVERIFHQQYKESRVTEDNHIKNILSLKKNIDSDSNFKQILRNGEITIGVVQKIINLYLKYNWCLGNCVEPPHCPFDRFIIKQLKIKPIPNWTKLNSETEYSALVDAAKNISGDKSIAQWELEVYSESR